MRRRQRDGLGGHDTDLLDVPGPHPAGREVVEKLRTDFEKANNVTVKIVKIPKDDYNTKLGSAVAAGTVPDVGILDQPLVARFALDGTIKEVPAGTVDEKIFYEGALNTNKVNDKLYGLPLDHTAVALFYNKTLVPTPPKTWDELKATAAKIHQADSKIAGMVVPKGDGYGGWMWPGFLGAAGGSLVDEKNKKILFDQQPGVDALQLWVDLLPSSPRQITDSDKPFENGLAGMMISGPWDVATIKADFPDLQFSTAPLPYKTEPAGNIGGENAVVFSKGKNAELAWKWLTFLTNAQNNTTLAQALGASRPTSRRPSGTRPRSGPTRRRSWSSSRSPRPGPPCRSGSRSTTRSSHPPSRRR